MDLKELALVSSHSKCNTHTTLLPSPQSAPPSRCGVRRFGFQCSSAVTEHLLCDLSAEDTEMKYPQQSSNPKGMKTGRHVIKT